MTLTLNRETRTKGEKKKSKKNGDFVVLIQSTVTKAETVLFIFQGKGVS